MPCTQVRDLLAHLWREDSGQDLIEYALLVSFMALTVVMFFLGAGKEVKGAWTTSNSRLTAANTAAS